MSGPPTYITDAYLDDLIERALEEDVRGGDITTRATIRGNLEATAAFVAKEDGILAGQAVADRILSVVDERISAEWRQTDGQTVFQGTTFGRAAGPAAGLLTAERLVLNVLQRMSGIATATRRFVDAVAGLPVGILDTRKTAPGLRLLDKWAVLLGGGLNHRVGLFDMILIKDNHIEAAGGIREALEAAATYRRDQSLEVLIEIETRTLDEVRAVLEVGLADRVLLDNMAVIRPDGQVDVSLLLAAVEEIDGVFETEASGNVTLETVRPIAETGVDFISSGALTHSVAALDISLQMTLARR